MPSDFLSPALAVALTAYAVGVASPGPSNMAIMATAMSQGRRQATAFAADLESRTPYFLAGHARIRI
jgi:threonine efflux protein